MHLIPVYSFSVFQRISSIERRDHNTAGKLESFCSALIISFGVTCLTVLCAKIAFAQHNFHRELCRSLKDIGSLLPLLKKDGSIAPIGGGGPHSRTTY